MERHPLEGLFYLESTLHPKAGRIVQRVDPGLFIVEPADMGSGEMFGTRLLFDSEVLVFCRIFDNRERWAEALAATRRRSR